MMLFPVFSAAFICLWSLLLASGPIYSPMLFIPAIASPVLTPLLSPADGPTILILTEMCDATVPITFPICNPSDVPLSSSSPPVVPCSQRALQLVAGMLILVCTGIVSCTKGTTRLADGGGSIAPVPFNHLAHPPSTSPSLPPAAREAGPNTDWTPLSQTGASESLRRQVLTRKTGVNMSGRVFRPSSADSGYEGSPSLSRRATSKQRRSRLRVVTSAGVNSPIPSGPFPATELGSGGPSGDDSPREGFSSVPLFNPPTHQGSEGGWPFRAVADDPFVMASFADRDSAPLGPLEKGIAATLKTPSKLTVNGPPCAPHPPRNRILNPAACISGFSSVPRITATVPIDRTGVSARKSAREARDAFLYLQAQHGHAAPSRLYCNFVNERSASLPARTPSIQALRDILESSKATLERLNERRLAWLSPPDTRSCSLDRSSIVEEPAFLTAPTPFATSQVSLKSSHPLEQGPINLEESKSTFDLPTDVSMLADEGMPFDADDASDDASYPVPPFETAFANSRKRKSASTSADVGLRLLLQAISERGEMSWYLDSEVCNEAIVSVDLTLGQPPSFLDDVLDLPVSHSSRPVVSTKDQDTRPASPAPAPAVDTPPSDVLLEDTAIANELPLSLLHENPIPSPSAPPFQTSLSFGRIAGFLKDILETPVRQFSCPTTTLNVHDACDMPPSSSLDHLEVMEGMSLLMDQSAPPSPVGSPTRFNSPIPPFQDVISQVRTRRAAHTIQQVQVPPSTSVPGIISAAQPGDLETSMSLGRVADFLGDIWAPPVHKFSNKVCFGKCQAANLITSSAISSESVIRIPEDMSYLVDQSIPSALVESSFGPATSVPSFKDVIQNLSGTAPAPGAHSTASMPRSLLGLGPSCISGPSHASPVSPRPRSGSSGSSFFMEGPENMTLLCEESLTDLSGDDNSFFF